MAGEQQPWQTGSMAQGGSLHSRQPSQHYSQQPPVPRRCSNSAISADPFIDPASAQVNQLPVSTRFSFRLVSFYLSTLTLILWHKTNILPCFRLKFGGILLLAKTSNGAVKFETSEMHVELSNRIGRTHTSWYTDSSSSFSAARPHAEVAASTPPAVKKEEKSQLARGDSTSRHQAPSETMSLTSRLKYTLNQIKKKHVSCVFSCVHLTR